jgi:SpoVK/Ycf46/Vps4 family AAA+-type ATPase
MFIECLNNSNFYVGKCVKFVQNGLSFIQKPNKNFSDVVLEEGMFQEYFLTVVDFLLDKKMQEVCKKRRVLLYGPPGTGKTSLTSATFNYLSSRDITCIALNDITSMRMSVEEIFDFITEYLAPAFIVFEDIDLIGFDRNAGLNPVIGRLLSLFDGIEETDKPIVICSTTNRINVLDRAFTRPCRIDRKFLLDNLKDNEIQKLFELLLDSPVPECLKGKKLTGAHVQEIADTAKLMAKKNSGNYKEHIQEATKVVLEHFYMIEGSGKVGFSLPKDGKICENDFPVEAVEESPWTQQKDL